MCISVLCPLEFSIIKLYLYVDSANDKQKRRRRGLSAPCKTTNDDSNSDSDKEGNFNDFKKWQLVNNVYVYVNVYKGKTNIAKKNGKTKSAPNEQTNQRGRRSRSTGPGRQRYNKKKKEGNDTRFSVLYALEFSIFNFQLSNYVDSVNEKKTPRSNISKRRIQSVPCKTTNDDINYDSDHIGNFNDLKLFK
jgi:hypothetical protein